MSRYRERLTRTAAAVALVPLAAACGVERAGGGSASAGTGPSLTGVHWAVDDVTVDGATSRAPDGAYLRIAGNGQVRGSLGCNGFGATATFEGGRVTFGRITSAGTACERVPASFERRLSATLTDGALTPRTTSRRLTLTTADGDRVRLTGEAHAPLYGTDWVVTSPGAGGRAHLTFDRTSGEVTGSLGCNHFRAGATVRDGHITLSAARLTKMMCDASLMRRERTLSRLLNGTVKYALEHRRLTLTSTNGERVSAVADG